MTRDRGRRLAIVARAWSRAPPSSPPRSLSPRRGRRRSRPRQRDTAYRAAVHLARDIGSRPAASRAELRAHRYVARRFRRAGLDTRYTRFRVPNRGRGRSQNVVGAYDGPHRCLKIVMAHTDSVPAGPGAVDNASGVGVVVALAGAAAADSARSATCGSSRPAERSAPTPGQADHLGARRLVKHVRLRRSARRLRYALSLDMVGPRRTLPGQLAARARPRPRVEGQVLRGGPPAATSRLRWDPDSGTGNSDHREFELAGLPGLVIHLWHGLEPCYHSACDTWDRLQRRSLRRVQRITEDVAATALASDIVAAMANKLMEALDPRVPIYRDSYNEYFVMVLSAGGAVAGTQVPLYIVMAITDNLWSPAVFVGSVHRLRAGGDLRPRAAADEAARARRLGGACGRALTGLLALAFYYLVAEPTL